MVLRVPLVKVINHDGIERDVYANTYTYNNTNNNDNNNNNVSMKNNPFPLSLFVMPYRPLSPSRRVLQRFYENCICTKVCNRVISSLNMLYNNMCDSAMLYISQASVCVSSLQKRMLHMILKQCQLWVRRGTLPTRTSDPINNKLNSNIDTLIDAVQYNVMYDSRC